MLVTTTGKRLLIVVSEEEKAGRPIIERLFRDPYFCYKYQVHYWRHCQWKRLGNDLSGQFYPDLPSATPAQAAEMLVALSGNKSKEVRQAKKRLPFTEGNLRFGRLGPYFLPAGLPVLFSEEKHRTLAQINEDWGLSLTEAAAWLVKTVEQE